MSAEKRLRIEDDWTNGRLVLQDENMTAVFINGFSHIERQYHMPEHVYNFGQVILSANLRDTESDTGHASQLMRTNANNDLFYAGSAPKDVRLGGNIMIMSTEQISNALRAMGNKAMRYALEGTEELSAAEQLYRAVSYKGIKIDGKRISACGAYEETYRGLRLVIVGRKKGYSYGVPPRDGIATDADLIASAVAQSVRI